MSYPYAPKAVPREETLGSPMLGTKPAVSVQMEMLEHQLNIQDEVLGTLGLRLNPVLRPLNVPVSGAGLEERKNATNSSLMVDMLSTLIHRVEQHNQRMSYIIEALDV